jgi:poly(3-hydroxybutyrate) depolymerase
MQKSISYLALIALIIPSFAAGLSKTEADAYSSESLAQRKKELKEERQQDFDSKTIKHGGLKMPYAFLKYGEAPATGHSLYISMHGGGNAPAAVNDRQWKNQIRLYKPKEGYYLAPRAATNSWNLWHEGHIDPMFDTLIENFVALKGVDPNKVYITGYSAGGDGTYQLAPRMADRWAAAAMMAGHPNEARPDNLYNLPFFIQCGGKDAAYDRNKIAAQWGAKLDGLAKVNPGAYKHKTIIYPNCGHWMNGKDAVAIPWMASHTRDPWPKHILWHQDDITAKRFYWLYNEAPKKDQIISATIDGQKIILDSDNVPTITLRLSDKLLNLEKEITVTNKQGKELFKGLVPRSKKAIDHSIQQRFDPNSVATALLKVTL